MNRPAWAIFIVCLGLGTGSVTSALLAEWTSSIRDKEFTEACVARNGEVLDLGYEKACIRRPRN